MTYIPKTAGQGELEAKENQQNPQDAKPDGYTSPWRGAAIGGTLGGLLTTALGYLYGHRGRWLAYDAIAGGSVGAGGGYAVYAHNNNSAAAGVKDKAITGPSREAAALRAEKKEEEEIANHQNAVALRKDTIKRGGFAKLSDNLKNIFQGGHISDDDQWSREKKQIQWSMVGR